MIFRKLKYLKDTLLTSFRLLDISVCGKRTDRSLPQHLLAQIDDQSIIYNTSNYFWCLGFLVVFGSFLILFYFTCFRVRRSNRWILWKKWCTWFLVVLKYWP